MTALTLGLPVGADRRAISGLGLGLAAVLMWGSYLAFARSGVNEGLAALDFVLLRYATAGAVMAAFLVATGGLSSLRTLGGVGWWRGGVLSLLAGPLFIGLGVGGYAYAPLAHGAVIQPAVLTLAGMALGALVLRERLTGGQLTGAALVIGGALLIARPWGAMAPSAWIGDLMFASAGLMFALFAVVVRLCGLKPIPATAALSVVSAIVAIPIRLAFGNAATLMDAGAETVLSQVIVQGLLSGVLAIAAFAAAVDRLGAARAALFPALVPAAALLIGVPVTGEMPASLDWAGMAVASFGLTVAAGIVHPPRKYARGWR